MSRIRVINERSVPRDSRVLEKLRKAARAATAAHARRFLSSNRTHLIPAWAPTKSKSFLLAMSYVAGIEANLRVVFYIERNTVVTVDIGSLEPDVAKVFPNAEAVNSSLRSLADIIRRRKSPAAK